jgi:hypothetical protein
MSDDEVPDDGSAKFVARLPSFIVDDEIGSGDVIKRLTGLFGVPACSACESRAKRLNGLLAFSPRVDRGRAR